LTLESASFIIFDNYRSFLLKFKSIFILFNVAGRIVPVRLRDALPGPRRGLRRDVLAANWPLASILVLVLATIDAFFALNWRLFTLLEREDWPALAHYLEGRIVEKGRWSPRLVRLLANTYLVLSDADSVVRLEEKGAAAKPSAVNRNTLVFGVARVLKNDPRSAAEFFAPRRGAKKSESPDWVEWYYAFCLLLDRKFQEAADVLVPLSASAKDALVIALTSSFLKTSVGKALPARADDCAAAAAAAAERVKVRFPTRAALDKEFEKARADIHVVVLSKSIEEAADQLYA
jgi:hypothetical protein